MSANKVSEPEDTDSSNAVGTLDDEQVSGSGSEGDIDLASAELKGKSAENETLATCKSKNRRPQTSGMEKEIRK